MYYFILFHYFLHFIFFISTLNSNHIQFYLDTAQFSNCNHHTVKFIKKKTYIFISHDRCKNIYHFIDHPVIVSKLFFTDLSILFFSILFFGCYRYLCNIYVCVDKYIIGSLKKRLKRQEHK